MTFKRGDLCILVKEHDTYPFNADKDSMDSSSGLIILTVGTIVEVIDHEINKFFAPFVWSPQHEKYFYINVQSLKHLNK